MADGFTEFPIYLISFVAGAAIIIWIFISKLVRRVLISKVSSTDAQEQTKSKAYEYLPVQYFSKYVLLESTNL